MEIPRIRKTEPFYRRNRRKIVGWLIVGVPILIVAALLDHQPEQSQTAESPIQPANESSALGPLATAPQPQDDLTKLGIEKVAEMTALVRHSEVCPDVPRQWAVAFLIVSVTARPTEDQVEAQEKKMLALRDEIGLQRWCLLYSTEMKEAYLVYRWWTQDQ